MTKQEFKRQFREFREFWRRVSQQVQCMPCGQDDYYLDMARIQSDKWLAKHPVIARVFDMRGY